MSRVINTYTDDLHKYDYSQLYIYSFTEKSPNASFKVIPLLVWCFNVNNIEKISPSHSILIVWMCNFLVTVMFIWQWKFDDSAFHFHFLLLLPCFTDDCWQRQTWFSSSMDYVSIFLMTAERRRYSGLPVVFYVNFISIDTFNLILWASHRWTSTWASDSRAQFCLKLEMPCRADVSPIN